MFDSSNATGYALDELEEQIIPPVAELDVLSPNIPLVIASVVLVVVIA